jgi:DNA mismatch endonuclease, patch repair protein
MDKLSQERRSSNMRAIRSKGMKPELLVRRLVYSLGFRYRLHLRDLPGKPDLVFIGLRKAIFVHGCFWHQHSGCREGRMPKSNLAYWQPKLARNLERDRASIEALNSLRWSTLVIWECQTSDEHALTGRIREFLTC